MPQTPEQATAWRSRNRERLREYAKEYYARRMANDKTGAFRAMKNEAAQATRRKRKYGVSREQYRAMLTQQDGRCKICNVRLNEELRVDHNHQTGQVRALLCTNCNSGLGMFKEDPTRLQRAIEYLKEYNG